MKNWPRLTRLFQRIGVSGALLIAIVGFLSYKYEDFKDDFPRLITWQLRAYQHIARVGPSYSGVTKITPIEIDDVTFYEFLNNKTRDDVTDRRFLAELVKAAVKSDAAVIALDINLDEASYDRASGKARQLSDDDKALLGAILDAQRSGIPVVLTFGFRKDMVPVTHIFENEPVLADGTSTPDDRGFSFLFPEDEKPARKSSVPRFGFDHPADDIRKVPLVVVGPDSDGKGLYDYYSFALQVTDAYSHSSIGELGHSSDAPARDEHSWQEELTKHEFVYTTFVPVSGFVNEELRAFSAQNLRPLSGIEVFCQKPADKPWNDDVCRTRNMGRVNAAEDLMRGKIVLIGGVRHGYRGETGPGDYLDIYQSPVGLLPGMYFQANYVAGLLDDRVLYEVPRWFAAALDVVLAFVTLAIATLERRRWLRAVLILLLLALPVGIAWAAAVFFHRCLDFVVPLILLVLHPALERYIDMIPALRHKEHAHA
jgi:hypothetical protein